VRRQACDEEAVMTAVRHWAWFLLRVVTVLFFLGVILQFFFVGVGLFGMHVGDTVDKASSLQLHRGFGWVLAQLGVVLFAVLTLVAWPKPRKILGLYVLLAVLCPVQIILAVQGVHHRYVGMFHPVNAVILLGLSGFLAHHGWVSGRKRTAPVPASTG
jgi:hypothetical protein